MVEGPPAPVARVALFGSDGGPAQVVRLDGSASSGHGLTYVWSLAAAPAAAAGLTAAGAVAFYRAAAPGTYVFRLTVTDSLGRSAGATTSIGIVASPPVARVAAGGRFEVYHPGLGTPPFTVEGNRGYLLIGPTATLVDFPGNPWGSGARQVELTVGLNLIAYPPPLPAAATSNGLLSGAPSTTWMVNPDPLMVPYLPTVAPSWALSRGRAYFVISPQQTTLQLPAGH